jgi:hypothetical protein
VNENGACPRCAAIALKVQERIERGQLPRISARVIKTPRLTRLARIGGGMPCAACDETISGEHWAYPDYPKPNSDLRGWDLHFHPLCHEIWDEEATFTD